MRFFFLNAVNFYRTLQFCTTVVLNYLLPCSSECKQYMISKCRGQPGSWLLFAAPGFESTRMLVELLVPLPRRWTAIDNRATGG